MGNQPITILAKLLELGNRWIGCYPSKHAGRPQQGRGGIARYQRVGPSEETSATFFTDDASRADAAPHVGRYASNPELSFLV